MYKRGLSFKLAIFIPLFLILTSTIALADSERTSLLDVLAGKVTFFDWLTGRQVQGTKLESVPCTQSNECAQGLYCAASPRGGAQRCCPIGAGWCSSNEQCILGSGFEASCPRGSRGDLNNNGEVDCLDLTILTDSVRGGGSMTPEWIARADITGDGQVDVNDITVLVDRIRTDRGLVCNIYPSGDVNGDNRVDCSDILLIRDAIVERISLTAAQRVRADLIRDSVVDIYDLLELQRVSQLTNCEAPAVQQTLSVDGAACTSGTMCVSNFCTPEGRCCPQGSIWCAGQLACMHSSECVTGVRFVGSGGNLPDLTIDNIYWISPRKEVRISLKNIGSQTTVPETTLRIIIFKGPSRIGTSQVDIAVKRITLGTRNSVETSHVLSSQVLQKLVGEKDIGVEVLVDPINRVRESNENNLFTRILTACQAQNNVNTVLNAQGACVSSAPPSPNQNQYTLNIGREIEVLGGTRVKLVESSFSRVKLEVYTLGRPLDREQILVNVNALAVSKGLAIANLRSSLTSATLQINTVTPGTPAPSTTTTSTAPESIGIPIEFTSIGQLKTLAPGISAELSTSSYSFVVLKTYLLDGTIRDVAIGRGQTKTVGTISIKHIISDSTSATLEIQTAQVAQQPQAQPSQQCTDTDTGRNYAVKGTVTYQGTAYQDRCSDSMRLTELYCDSSGVKREETIPCGYGCSNGKCNPAVPQTIEFTPQESSREFLGRTVIVTSFDYNFIVLSITGPAPAGRNIISLGQQETRTTNGLRITNAQSTQGSASLTIALA